MANVARKPVSIADGLPGAVQLTGEFRTWTVRRACSASSRQALAEAMTFVKALEPWMCPSCRENVACTPAPVRRSA